MVLESGYWKHELRKMSAELKISCMHRKGIVSMIRERYSCWKNGAGYLDYRMERNVILSAFVVRLLFESSKLSEECESHCIVLERYEASEFNNRGVYPINRRFDLDKLYNLAEPNTVRMGLNKFVNQVIHTAVVLSFVTNDAHDTAGFFVVSDYDSMKGLYYCSMPEWLKLLRLVADDDVVSLSWLWDVEREEWITSRSRKLPSDAVVDLPSGQLV